MKTITLSILFTCFYSLLPAQNSELKSLSQTFIKQFKEKRSDSIYNTFDKDLKREVSFNRLTEIIDNFEEKYGELIQIEETTLIFEDTITLSETPISFEKKKFLFLIRYNKQNEVCGFFIRNKTIPYSPPEYVNPLNFYDLKMNIAARGISNQGILSIPRKKGKYPLVIISGGSGPTDMDGTVGPNKPYKDIAWALAAKGIAVYRFNKRTYNAGNFTNFKPEKFGLKEEYMDDMTAVVNELKKHPSVSSSEIYILGHSQGGSMIPYYAKELNKKVNGYICLAGNYSTLPSMLQYQFSYFRNESSDTADINACNEMIAKANYMVKNTFNKNALSDSLIEGITQYYLQDMETHSPAALMNSVKNKNILFINGGRDYQVPLSEQLLWQKRSKDHCCTTFITFDKLNHIMQEGDQKSLPAEYNKQLNVPEYLPDYISDWILKQRNKL